MRRPFAESLFSRSAATGTAALGSMTTFIVSQTRRMALKMTGPRHVPHRMHTSQPISVRLFAISCSKDFAVKIHFCFKGGTLELFQT